MAVNLKLSNGDDIKILKIEKKDTPYMKEQR
jgi:hypothetical protein